MQTIFVLPLEQLEQLDLRLPLPMKPLFVSHYLDGHVLLCLVVVCFYHIAKRARAEPAQNLKAICNVVVADALVPTFVVVVALVVGLVG